MRKPNDLSRSLTVLKEDQTLIAVIEMSHASLNESQLDPGAPVTAGQCYVAVGAALPSPMVAPMFVGDGVVIVSPITGTASDLAASLGASAIRAIDLIGRRDCFADSGAPIFE